MPTAEVNGATLHYEVVGEGPDTIVFLHGLLTSGLVWGAQMAAFSIAYRCVTVDFRGQGSSAVTEDGYDMETLALDVAAFIETVLGGAVHLAGLSMGGFVAMRVAARQPSLVRSLILVDTSSEAEPAENMSKYQLFGFVSRWFGFRVTINRVMPILFGQTFLADPARGAEREVWRARLLANDRTGALRALDGAVQRMGVNEELARVRAPTLVIVGEEDVATRPVKAERIQERIAGSRLVVIKQAGHTAPVEQPALVTEAIGTFLAGRRQGHG